MKRRFIFAREPRRPYDRGHASPRSTGAWIAERPLSAQARLLGALESHEVRPLGSDASAAFEARIVAATNRDIGAAAREGRFREDLY
jgi:transcriptional regulator of acetoin/glycerol metabolism